MSNFLLEIRIALRYLFNRTEENFISLVSIFSFAGIMLGVATLIIVISVMNGFREKLIDNIIGVGGHISIVSYKDEIENYQKIVEDLKNQNLNIKKIVPMIQSQGLANLNNNNVGLMIFAIENLQDKEIVLNSLKDPEQNFIDNFSELKKIVVGSRFAESMNLRVGDYINLISSKSVSSVLGDIPRMKEYEIGAIFETGVFDFDNNVIFMPLKEGRIFFQLYDSVNKIEIDLQSPNDSEKLMMKLRNDFVSEEREDLIVNDWQSSNSHYLSALKTEKNVMFLILSLIILVAIFNIISSLVMLVTEKQKSIAILRSFGMTKRSIMRIFIYCGMMIAITSTFFGVLLGILISKNINSIKMFIENLLDTALFDQSIYIFNEMPSIVRFNDVFYIVAFSIIVSFFAVLWPSKKASEKDPARILRYL
jgi:lipoprotein-releasing system permease protein